MSEYEQPFIPASIQATGWTHLGWHEVYPSGQDSETLRNAVRRFERINNPVALGFVELPWDSSDLYIAYQIGRVDEAITRDGYPPWGVTTDGRKRS